MQRWMAKGKMRIASGHFSLPIQVADRERAGIYLEKINRITANRQMMSEGYYVLVG
jgi:hypothetical protein